MNIFNKFRGGGPFGPSGSFRVREIEANTAALMEVLGNLGSILLGPSMVILKNNILTVIILGGTTHQTGLPIGPLEGNFFYFFLGHFKPCIKI